MVVPGSAVEGRQDSIRYGQSVLSCFVCTLLYTWVSCCASAGSNMSVLCYALPVRTHRYRAMRS
eukprot:3906107-Rhodomonas_salina.1